MGLPFEVLKEKTVYERGKGDDKIAGLIYLLPYFMEEGRGMSEREKDAFVAAIFCLLAY